ncbi:DUF305 domain-containing protein [Actinomadura yumaensis]|uniref:DUF305 domain-containing protein n=2 Tax=Actinomadura yumaensis TaxID=111807 RepID=A0ABW2CU76_9ACTN
MRYAVLGLAAACALLLAVQCGARGSGGAGPGRSFNGTDVMVLQMLVPHHGQGVRIARLARGRPVRPQVATLAAAIESTQVGEVRAMAGWLRGWRRPPTAPAHDHAAHGGMPMTPEREIAALAASRDAGFERRFLNVLIGHQDDALQIARLETRSGRNARARELAWRIDASRTAQIKQMVAFLNPGKPVPPQK